MGFMRRILFIAWKIVLKIIYVIGSIKGPFIWSLSKVKVCMVWFHRCVPTPFLFACVWNVLYTGKSKKPDNRKPTLYNKKPSIIVEEGKWNSEQNQQKLSMKSFIVDIYFKYVTIMELKKQKYAIHRKMIF